MSGLSPRLRIGQRRCGLFRGRQHGFQHGMQFYFGFLQFRLRIRVGDNTGACEQLRAAPLQHSATQQHRQFTIAVQLQPSDYAAVPAARQIFMFLQPLAGRVCWRTGDRRRRVQSPGSVEQIHTVS